MRHRDLAFPLNSTLLQLSVEPSGFMRAAPHHRMLLQKVLFTRQHSTQARVRSPRNANERVAKQQLPVKVHLLNARQKSTCKVHLSRLHQMMELVSRMVHDVDRDVACRRNVLEDWWHKNDGASRRDIDGECTSFITRLKTDFGLQQYLILNGPQCLGNGRRQFQSQRRRVQAGMSADE